MWSKVKSLFELKRSCKSCLTYEISLKNKTKSMDHLREVIDSLQDEIESQKAYIKVLEDRFKK